MPKIKVLLADDHPVVREGLKQLLQSDSDIEVVGEAANGLQAVALTIQTWPDIVILDLEMPVMNGINAARQILRKVEGARIIVLSCYQDDATIRAVVSAGASGFIIKNSGVRELLLAIHEVHKGTVWFSPSIAKRIRQEQKIVRRPGQSEDHLTAREVQVLQFISEGSTNKAMAAEMGISVKTVEKHRQQVMNKLDLHNIAGLTRHVIQQISWPLVPSPA
jgi:DNA-binding NarL/FixJ family response regulator